MRKRRGFTLVELLVVIGIIALLISFLMPALTNARDRAGTIACLAQQRMLGMSFFMYNNEWKGKYPIGCYWKAGFGLDPAILSSRFVFFDRGASWQPAIYWSWKDAIDPYVKADRAWNCPRQDSDLRSWMVGGTRYVLAGYAMNPSLGGGGNKYAVGQEGSPWFVFEYAYQQNQWVESAKIKHRTEKVMMGCAAQGVRPMFSSWCYGCPLGDFGSDPPRYSLPHQWESFSGAFVEFSAHRAGCPVIFTDGHGQVMTKADNFGVVGNAGSGSPPTGAAGDSDKWLNVYK